MQKILLESVNICGGDINKLKDLIDGEKFSSKTVFDFNWNGTKNHNEENIEMFNKLVAFNGLQVGPDSFEFDWIGAHPILNTLKDSEKDIAEKYMRRAARILSVNCYSLDWITPEIDSSNISSNFGSQRMKIGSGLFIFGSLFNHSCAPNIDRILVDNKFVFYVRSPIKPGEQLFISYG